MAELQPRVLVVDDERFFREAIVQALDEAGIACDAVASGDEALRAALDPEVGVVVLDVTLADVPGIEVLRRLRAERPGLRVIVLSGQTDQELVLEALRLDASDYLAKPLHDEELVLAEHALRDLEEQLIVDAVRREHAGPRLGILGHDLGVRLGAGCVATVAVPASSRGRLLLGLRRLRRGRRRRSGVDGWAGSGRAGASELLAYLSMLRHYELLLKGLFNSTDIIYYLLVIVLFLGLSIRRLDAQRLP